MESLEKECISDLPGSSPAFPDFIFNCHSCYEFHSFCLSPPKSTTRQTHAWLTGLFHDQRRQTIHRALQKLSHHALLKLPSLERHDSATILARSWVMSLQMPQYPQHGWQRWCRGAVSYIQKLLIKIHKVLTARVQGQREEGTGWKLVRRWKEEREDEREGWKEGKEEGRVPEWGGLSRFLTPERKGFISVFSWVTRKLKKQTM